MNQQEGSNQQLGSLSSLRRPQHDPSPDRPAIYLALDSVEGERDQLAKQLDRLEERLADVLQLETKGQIGRAPEGTQVPCPPRSAITHRLTMNLYALEQMNSKVASILARLEV